MRLFQTLLAIHIAGGGLSLLLGVYVLIAKKGSNRHRTTGLVYFYAMLVSALSALWLSYLHPNAFLFIIGVFTSYMLLTGKRYLQQKTPAHVTRVDWMLAGLMLVFGSGFMYVGVRALLQANSFGIVFLVFGIISLLFVWQDYRNFNGQSKYRNAFLTTHIQRMIGSYIASVTAFLVVNNTVLPGVVAWLLPTVCLAPLIATWTRRYKVVKPATPAPVA